MRHLLLAVCCLTAVIEVSIGRAADIDFAHEVQPILSKRCAKCHSGTQRKGGLSINSRQSLLSGGESGRVVHPGKSGDSPLMTRITATDNSERMPPEGEPLTTGMSLERFRRRYDTFRKMVSDGSPLSPRADQTPLSARAGYTDAHRNALLRSVEQAHRLMDSSAAKAFDLSLEPKESFDTYNTCKFGLGCLLARRLVEEGARFIEVTTEYGPFLQWDTHDNGHTRLAKLKSEIDAPIAQLVLDLERRGLLDRTLIVLASEFSRDCLLEGKPEKPVGNQVEQPAILKELKHYNMHRHFNGASSVLMFGGGVKRGFLYGKTADERPCTTVENPINVMDLHATILHALGNCSRLQSYRRAASVLCHTRRPRPSSCKSAPVI